MVMNIGLLIDDEVTPETSPGFISKARKHRAPLMHAYTCLVYVKRIVEYS